MSGSDRASSARNERSRSARRSSRWRSWYVKPGTPRGKFLPAEMDGVVSNAADFTPPSAGLVMHPHQGDPRWGLTLCFYY